MSGDEKDVEVEAALKVYLLGIHLTNDSMTLCGVARQGYLAEFMSYVDDSIAVVDKNIPKEVQEMRRVMRDEVLPWAKRERGVSHESV
jgi:hypothetical protein